MSQYSRSSQSSINHSRTSRSRFGTNDLSSTVAPGSLISQIKAELREIDAELASLRAEDQEGAGSVVSGSSRASSVRPEDSVSNVSSQRSSLASRRSTQGLPAQVAPMSTATRTSRGGTRISSTLRGVDSRFVPGFSSGLSQTSDTSQSQAFQSSAAHTRSQPSIQRRADGSYWDINLRATIRVEERAPDMYGCVNDRLRLDGNGDYDLDDDCTSHRIGSGTCW